MRALRRLLPFLALGLLLPTPVLAVDTFVGTITSSGASTTNLTTATPFTLYARTRISIQCTAATYVAEAPEGATLTVTASNGVLIQANALFDIDLNDTSHASAATMIVGILPVSGADTCTTFRSLP